MLNKCSAYRNHVETNGMHRKKKSLSAIFGAIAITQVMTIPEDSHAFSTTSTVSSAATVTTIVNDNNNYHDTALDKCRGHFTDTHHIQSDETHNQKPREQGCTATARSVSDPFMDILYAGGGLTLMIILLSLFDYSWKRTTNFKFGTKDYPTIRKIFGPVADYESFTPLVQKLRHPRKKL